MTSSIFISLIVPVTRATASDLMQSFLLQHDADQAELILITDPELFSRREILCPERIRLISSNCRHPSYRRNIGVRAARGVYLGFLDDDILLPPGWLKAVVTALMQEKAVVCGPTAWPDDKLGMQVAQGLVDSWFATGAWISQKLTVQRLSFHQVYLCNCIMHRSIWENIGGFNEVVDYHADDTEFFFLAQRMGVPLVSEPSLLAYHRPRHYPCEYLKHACKAASATGMHTVLLPHIYLRIPTIPILFLSIIIFGLALSYHWSQYLLAFYFSIMLASSITSNVPFYVKPLLPFAFLTNHACSLLGFLWGIVHTVVSKSHYRHVVEEERRRLKNCPSTRRRRQ